jgi:hypothetical protein
MPQSAEIRYAEINQDAALAAVSAVHLDRRLAVAKNDLRVARKTFRDALENSEAWATADAKQAEAEAKVAGAIEEAKDAKKQARKAMRESPEARDVDAALAAVDEITKRLVEAKDTAYQLTLNLGLGL